MSSSFAQIEDNIKKSCLGNLILVVKFLFSICSAFLDLLLFDIEDIIATIITISSLVQMVEEEKGIGGREEEGTSGGELILRRLLLGLLLTSSLFDLLSSPSIHDSTAQI